jgi:ATP-dependent helicase/nuclease subunit A
MADPAFEANGQRVARDAFYAIACDPRRSVAVEACAGAGKTWMLVSRIVRALLDGVPPHEVLAITFTRKAAGEMRERLQEWLREFAAAPLERLQPELVARGVEPAQAAALAPALQGLHARVLAAGRGVQVRTFHSWFAALLRSAPLATLEQLGLPARHELLEDDGRAIDKVWRRFHTVVAQDADARRDYEALVAAHGRWQALKALRSALDKRVEFRLADAGGVVDASVQSWRDRFPALAALGQPEDSLDTPAARERWLARARALGAQENKTPRKAADAVVTAFACDDVAQRMQLLRKAFFVASEDRLTQHLVRYEPAQEAEAELQQLCAACAQRDAWEHQGRMARLARLLLAEYAALKREQGWVDMSDVEQAAHRLLSDDVLAGWVQERLDARVSHLLVDEFQDTNPLQWQALHAWLSGYAGAGAGGPSVFIVGDPKQSIYRFRRAEPQVFAAARRFVREGLGGDLLSCDHTRRNAPEVLGLVNTVMGQAQAVGEYEGFRAHTTESAAPGRLWRLPPVPRPVATRQEDAAPEWRDSLTQPRELPEEHLVALECRQAARWVAARVAAGVAPRDIMVLARKRDRLAFMEDELRELQIPARQPEKSDLADAPEVQDVAALLDVLVSPAHDLSLARALKSPLFGLSDTDLAELALRARAAVAAGAPRPWIELLRAQDAGAPEPLRAIGERLARWQAWLDRLPPHDALHAIFEDGDVLARYAAAVPPALRELALANLRAVPAAALQVEGGRYATPYAFVRALKAGGLAAPASAQADAVRLLTVHGAKGLEAPLVLLLDTDTAAPRADTMGILLDWPGEAAAPRRFTFLVSESRPPACNAQPLQAEQAARAREELNALYVAMTRARSELVISSVQPRQAADTSWWQRLAPHCEEPAAPDAPVPQAAPAAAPHVLRVVPRWTAPAAPAVARTEDSAESRFGQAVHRLLELQLATGTVPASRLARLGREFGLDAGALRQAREMAGRIATGEGAWAWDARQLAWAGDEVELVHEGQALRLDRLVQLRDGGWWVLDYKSATRPQDDPALLAQLRRYGRAVAALNPGEPVQLAFLTGAGRLVRVAAEG